MCYGQKPLFGCVLDSNPLDGWLQSTGFDDIPNPKYNRSVGHGTYAETLKPLAENWPDPLANMHPLARTWRLPYVRFVNCGCQEIEQTRRIRSFAKSGLDPSGFGCVSLPMQKVWLKLKTA